MAPRRRDDSPMLPSTNVLKVKRVMFKRSKVTKGVRVLMPSASEKTWKTKKSEDGLLDVSNIPPWLTDVFVRNATASPLLRLPGELRNKIWQYAMTGNIINIHMDEDRTVVDSRLRNIWVACKGHAVGIIGKDNPLRWLSTKAEDKPRLPAAFHLGEVSRQIYKEVASLAYSGSIFLLCNWKNEGELVQEGGSTLATAHKNAITDIAFEDTTFDAYMEMSLVKSPNMRVKLRNIFPSLLRLHLNTGRVNRSHKWSNPANTNLLGEEHKRREEMNQARVERREGGMVKIVWHEHPIEDYDMWEDTDDDSVGHHPTDDDDPVEAPTEVWTVETEEDSEGENETDFQPGVDDDGMDASGDDTSESSYDADMLDIGRC